jgi:hypothetical protein
VIAERTLRLARTGRRATTVRVRFGKPVRCRRPVHRDPWWCPVEIRGLGDPALRAIAGVDSLQALVLALEFVSRVLPSEARRAGGHIEWLGEGERPIFAHTDALAAASFAQQNLIEGLALAVSLLESESSPGPLATARLAGSLRALVASGGWPSGTKRAAGPRSGPREVGGQSVRAGRTARRPTGSR